MREEVEGASGASAPAPVSRLLAKVREMYANNRIRLDSAWDEFDHGYQIGYECVLEELAAFFDIDLEEESA